jgi:hypothetical protein
MPSAFSGDGSGAASRAASLKDQNRWPLLAVLTINLAFFLLVVKAGTLDSFSTEYVMKHWKGLLPSGLGVIFVGIINSIMSSNAKARIVYWKWYNPLPGCRAFSHFAENDARIKLSALRKIVGKFPTDPKEQNAVWYKLYRSIQRDPAVNQLHKHVLFKRDYAVLSFLFIMILGTIGFYFIIPMNVALIYFVILVAQYLLVRYTAKNDGERLVTTVLAIKAAGQ